MQVLRQREQFAYRLAASTKLYRGLNIDTRQPGLEKVHSILNPPGTQPLEHHPGWDHPEVGTHLLNWLSDNRSGLGRHWSEDPAQAETFARWPDETTGRGGNLQAVVEGDWGGQGADPNRTNTREFNDAGEQIRSFPWEKEHTLSPGAHLNVTGLKIRPYDDEYWNGPSTGDEPIDENHEGPWHSVLGASSSRTAAAAEPFMVPTEHLAPHIVFDRSTMMEQSKPNFQELLAHIKKHGIQDPVTMETDGQTGTLADGNHRWAAAKILGLPHVPTRFVRENTKFLQHIGAPELHPMIRQHLAAHPEAIQEDVERQPSWQQGER
jgi:hypothetical protein